MISQRGAPLSSSIFYTLYFILLSHCRPSKVPSLPFERINRSQRIIAKTSALASLFAKAAKTSQQRAKWRKTSLAWAQLPPTPNSAGPFNCPLNLQWPQQWPTIEPDRAHFVCNVVSSFALAERTLSLALPLRIAQTRSFRLDASDSLASSIKLSPRRALCKDIAAPPRRRDLSANSLMYVAQLGAISAPVRAPSRMRSVVV